MAAYSGVKKFRNCVASAPTIKMCLALKVAYQDGEITAYSLFSKVRWPEKDGAPMSPLYGCLNAYEITTRRNYNCKACQHQFSVTSGTIFASRKLPFTDMLAAIPIVSNAAKGVSAMQLARHIDVQHKTAWVLAHKLREAMRSETAGFKLSGIVETDGAYFGGHVRPDHRELDNGAMTNRAIGVAMAHPVSRV